MTDRDERDVYLVRGASIRAEQMVAPSRCLSFAQEQRLKEEGGAYYVPLWALLAPNVCGPCWLPPVLLRVPAWLCPCAFHWTSYMYSPSGLGATLAAMARLHLFQPVWLTVWLLPITSIVLRVNGRDVISTYLSLSSPSLPGHRGARSAPRHAPGAPSQYFPQYFPRPPLPPSRPARPSQYFPQYSPPPPPPARPERRSSASLAPPPPPLGRRGGAPGAAGAWAGPGCAAGGARGRRERAGRAWNCLHGAGGVKHAPAAAGRPAAPRARARGEVLPGLPPRGPRPLRQQRGVASVCGACVALYRCC